MIAKLMIFAACINYFVSTSLIRDLRLRRSIDKNLKITKLTTSIYAEAVNITSDSKGVRVKRQNDDANQEDYTLSTAYDEDEGLEDITTLRITTTLKSAIRSLLPVKPTVKQQVMEVE